MASDTSNQLQPSIGPTALRSPPNTPPGGHGASASQEAEDLAAKHASISYSAAFTDALMSQLLSAQDRAATSVSRRTTGAANGHSNASKSSLKEDGIRVLPQGSNEPGAPGLSVPIADIDPTSLPDIDPGELPLPLDDSRRVYASGVPGVRLTHPGGWLEGGAGPGAVLFGPHRANNDAAAHAAHEYMQKHGIETSAALRAHVSAEVSTNVEELKRRMAERKAAVEKNDRLEREIRDLVAERDMERRVHERQMSMRRQKMQQRERRGDAG